MVGAEGHFDAVGWLTGLPGTELKDAAWFYPEPMEKAVHIKDHVAFCE